MTRTLFTLGFGFALALACGTAETDDGGGATDATSCEHGTYSACTCTDGTMGTQLCAHDTSGFEECICGGDEDPSGIATSDDPSSPSDTGSDPTTASDTTPDETTTAMTSSDDSTDDSIGTTDASDGSTTASVGESPTAMITHPGGEDRQVGVPIPFTGVANDAEDGPLSGASMQWTDDVEGPIGQGEGFEAAFDVLGEHTVTLTAMDSDGNIGEATLTFTIVE